MKKLLVVLSLPLLTLLCITAFYFTSCTPDETPICGTAYNTTVNFTADDLSKVPYTGFDTLYFKDINGDTNIVVGSGKQYYYDKEYKTHGGPACPPDVTNLQAYKIQFNPIKGDLNFKFIQQRDGSWFAISKTKYSCVFIFEYYLLKDSTLVYKGVPISNITDIADTTYACTFNLKQGILHFKSLKENEEYTLLKK